MSPLEGRNPGSRRDRRA